MGEVEGVSDGNMTQGIDVDQVNSTVNNAESSPVVTETIDGYSFAIGGQPPLVWKPFSRIRCSSPDVVSNVEPQDLVKIAASASEAFEQVSDKVSKQKEGKDSKRGKKAATEEATTPSGRKSTKKRGREPEEKEEVVETPPPKGKSRKASKEVQPTPPKRPSKEKEKPSAEPLETEKKTSKEKTKKRSKSKKDKSKSPERTVREESEDEDVKVKADTPSSPDVKKFDDNKSAPKTHSKRSISASPGEWTS
ncbi:unnamed protein product [Nippostrongylus brasiliensis]|uniref:Uncharacterized protein n=1 Tax=Nippostrongylus brasiliensis TaxID=27835 RepID=A0A0N4XJ36_NIPBR|nr:unnamed protein product [Nippostrongylus brasiliensis]